MSSSESMGPQVAKHRSVTSGYVRATDTVKYFLVAASELTTEVRLNFSVNE